MLVIDSMHCILKGIVHYHCCYVLGLDAKKAATSVDLTPSFSYSWVLYNPHVPLECRVKHEGEIKHIPEIHMILTLPFDAGPGSLNPAQLMAKLSSKNLAPLRFVCYSLSLPMSVISHQNVLVPAKTKMHFCQLLIDWVS